MKFRGKLAVVLVVLAFGLLFLPNTSLGAESGDINVTSLVVGPAPATPPTIDQPTNNFVSAQKNITVSGTCLTGSTVKVFSNAVFVGSTPCRADGTYSLPVDIFLNKNLLIARQYDTIGQPSPDSAEVTVYYVPPAAQPGQGEPEVTASFQLVIDYDYTAHGVFIDQAFKLPIHFIGGTAPYTVTVDWGDGSSNNFVRPDTNKFTTEYTYTRAGSYVAVIRVTDSSGQAAYLQFVVLVHAEDDDVGFMQRVQQGLKDPELTLAFLIVGLGMFGLGLLVFALIMLWIKLAKKRKQNTMQTPS